MAKKAEVTAPAAEELKLPPDILKILEALLAGKVPVQAMDPATAAFNFGTAALFLIGKIIDTVPEAQHEKNWKRFNDLIDKLRPS